MITGGDLRQSRLDVGYKTFTISPCKVPEAKAEAAKLKDLMKEYHGKLGV